MKPRRWDCDKGGFMFLADEGKWVYWEDYAELKAENERIRKYWKATGEGVNKYVGKALELEDKVAALQAEVERLEKDVWRMKVFKGVDEDAIATLKAALNTVPEWAKVLESIENNARLETDNIALQAENERLRKAGDAMAAIIRPPAHGPGEWEGEYEAWLAAKGGQP